MEIQSTKTEILSQSTEVSGNQLVQGFFQDNNDDQKKKKLSKRKRQKQQGKRKHHTLLQKLKAKNFLSNIAYKRICEKDFSNICFLIDVSTFITMDLKPFFLASIYFDVEDRDMIKMLWEECIPQGYYNFVKRPENFELLHSTNRTFKQVNGIVEHYLQMPNTWSEMIRFFTSYASVYQYVYVYYCFQSLMQTKINTMGQKKQNKVYYVF